MKLYTLLCFSEGSKPVQATISTYVLRGNESIATSRCLPLQSCTPPEPGIPSWMFLTGISTHGFRCFRLGPTRKAPTVYLLSPCECQPFRRQILADCKLRFFCQVTPPFLAVLERNLYTLPRSSEVGKPAKHPIAGCLLLVNSSVSLWNSFRAQSRRLPTKLLLHPLVCFIGNPAPCFRTQRSASVESTRYLAALSTSR